MTETHSALVRATTPDSSTANYSRPRYVGRTDEQGAEGGFRHRAVGLLIASGCFGAVLASALATTVAPAPAQALDACASAFGATLGAGSAHCSSSLGTFSVAIGANTIATSSSGVGNIAFAVGANSEATVDGTSSNFNVATAWFGGFARVTNGSFNLANAVLTGKPIPGPIFVPRGSFAGAGNFNIANAVGRDSYASAFDGDFNAASSLGDSVGAQASAGSFNLAQAIGESSAAFSLGGNAQIAITISNRGGFASARGGTAQIALSLRGREALASDGFLNRALAVGNGSTASAGGGNNNRARVLGGGSTATARNGSNNSASVLGNGSTATAGPGNNYRIVVVGKGRSGQKPGQNVETKAAATRSR